MINKFNSLRTGFPVCVAGVPGVGKTTILCAHVDKEKRDMQITGSSIIKSIIAPATVKDLDSWSSEKRDSIRRLSIKKLDELRKQCNGRLLIDGHFTLRNRISGKFESIFTDDDKEFFKALVLVDASAKSIFLQRALSGRDRGAESIQEITDHIDYERQEGRRLAAVMEVPLLELCEPDDLMRLKVLRDFLNSIAPLK